MKYTFTTCLLVMLLSAKSFAQVSADPGVSGFDVTNTFLVSQNANQLGQGHHYILRLPIFNSNQSFALPAGTCKLKIGLGSKAAPDYPNPALPTVNYSQYFSWTASNSSGQWEVTGDLIAPLPADFDGIVDVAITPTVLGTSLFTANFLTTNHAPVPPSNTLSDEDPNNNSTSTSYTVIIIMPVKFTSLDVIKSGCKVKANFTIEEQLNVDHYEIEASKDGVNFIKVAETAAKSQSLYKTEFPITDQLRANKLFVRVKSVDIDGHVQYSEIKTVSGICDKALLMNIYPNPVSDQKAAVINAVQGLFNGKYKVSIRDITGRLLRVNEVSLVNATKFDCEIGNLAAGKYIVQVNNTDGSESAVLQLQKL